MDCDVCVIAVTRGFNVEGSTSNLERVDVNSESYRTRRSDCLRRVGMGVSGGELDWLDDEEHPPAKRGWVWELPPCIVVKRKDLVNAAPFEQDR